MADTWILEAVLEHARTRGEREAVRTVSRSGEESARTFAAIVQDAGRAAAAYRAAGIEKGEIVILIGTHHIDFYAAWLGAVWIGAVPSVLAEPSVRIDKEIYWTRLAELLERIGAKMLATDPRIEIDEARFGSTRRTTYSSLATHDGKAPDPVAPAPEDLLLLQHSSGTTGLQKGVMLSHRAVMRHAESYLSTLELRAEDKIATWLPLYHDMGLIACFVTPLVAGIPVVWLSPFEWVAAPTLLLRAITQHRATLAWLPNFAFTFLGKRAARANEVYDLASLRAVVNCSEPVTHEAMSCFHDRYRAEGFRADALHTCYAMAENVFAVSTSSPAIPSRRLVIDAAKWQEEHRAVDAADASAQTLVHVSNGVTVPSCEVRIADASGAILPPRQAGRVLIRSPFLFDGYFRRDDLNRGLLDARGFYDTGDVGYLDELGHVYVTGRMKDLVIVGGRNIYPQDIEQIASEVEGVHPGRAVCFGVKIKGVGTEGPVVLAESDLPESSWLEVSTRIRAAIPARLDLDLADVRVTGAGRLRKSTSGKLARSGNREWYLEGRFGDVPRHIDSTP
jgi:acyl-CoA synthetase (AMP-forming)/AMP-acid ligase II